MSNQTPSSNQEPASTMEQRAEQERRSGERAEREREREKKKGGAPAGRRPAEAAKEQGEKALSFLRKKPSVGALIAAGIGFVAANAVGVGELAIAMAAGYAAYRMLKEQ